MFFEVFEKLCQNRGISPTKASTEIGFSKGSVSYWRKNYHAGIDAKPDVHTAQKIADYFNVTVDYLLGRQEEHALLTRLDMSQPNITGRHVFHDNPSQPLNDETSLSFEEQIIIDAYRHNPEIRELIQQALGVRKLEPKK